VTDQPTTAYLAVIARRKWWVIGLTVLAVVAALGVSLLQTKRYSAIAQVLAASSANLSSPGATEPLTAGQLATLAELVQSPQVVRLADRQPGMGRATGTVSASLVGATNLVAITATSLQPGEAAVVADAYAYGLTTYEESVATAQAQALVSSYQRSLTALGPKISAAQARNSPTASQLPTLLSQQTLLEQDFAGAKAALAQAATGISVASLAQVPTSPSSPRPVLNTLLGLIVGLFLGTGVAFGLDHFDDKVISRRDLDLVVRNLPVLGEIPWVKSWKRPGKTILVSRSEPTAPPAEAYWSLRTAVMFILQERPARTIVVTSAGQSEGKTSTTANLGVVFARGGHRTVVVSCDLRRPRLARFFEFAPKFGFTSVLRGDVTLRDAVQAVPGVENLWILDAGPVPVDPHEALGSRTTR